MVIWNGGRLMDGSMNATHTDYQHPRHLRVETGVVHQRWSLGRGWEATTAVCLVPSHSAYGRLNKMGLRSCAPKVAKPMNVYPEGRS